MHSHTLFRPISEKIASLERLKALSISTNAFSETAIKPLAEIQGLQHLSMIEMDSYQLTPGESVLASLIRNSRPTLKSLRVIGIGYTTSFLNHLRETVPTSRGSANAQHHIFSALKSLTLEDTTLDTEVIRHLKNSVDFLGLDELEVRRVAGASELFFNTLTKMAVTTSHIRLHTLFLTLSSVKNDETDEELQQPATVTQLHKPLIKMKCQFISAFNTLTSLEIHNDSRHMIDTTADPVIEGQVLQAITQHKGLKMLKISFGELISNRRVSYLSARSVSALVNNLPHLEEIEFAPEENEIVRRDPVAIICLRHNSLKGKLTPGNRKTLALRCHMQLNSESSHVIPTTASGAFPSTLLRGGSFLMVLSRDFYPAAVRILTKANSCGRTTSNWRAYP